MRYIFQLKSIDKLVDGQVVRQIGLVTENQNGYALHGRLVQQVVKFFSGNVQTTSVGRVNDIPERSVISSVHPLGIDTKLTRSPSRRGSNAPTYCGTWAGHQYPSCLVSVTQSRIAVQDAEAPEETKSDLMLVMEKCETAGSLHSPL